MRSLLDAKFDQFVEDFNLRGTAEDVSWRRFVIYQFFSQFQPGRLDTDADLFDQTCVESSAFSQVQGVLFLLNDQIISEPQDIDDILEKSQKGLLEMYFLTFGNLDSLLHQLENLFQQLDVIEKNENWIRILDYAMSQKIVLQWKDNPLLNIVVYGADRKDDEEIECAFDREFSAINLIKIDRERLLELVKSNENSYQVSLNCQILPLSVKSKKIDTAFVAYISATELMKMVITSDGLFRRDIFDDSVRTFRNFSTVTQEMMSTIKEDPNQFGLFNNGITIICKNAKVEDRKCVLKNPKIVNGYQTCSVIYQAYQWGISLNGVQVIAKVVASDDNEVIREIIMGVNRQVVIHEESFETTRNFHIKLEKYFENRQVEGYQKIYYERHSGQYTESVQIKPQQKISFRGLIQSMVALFLNHVEESHRHESKLLSKYKDHLFIDTHSCLPYYVAAFLYLNVEVLFREGKLPKKLSSLKMHIMLLIKEMNGGISPELSSDEIDPYCNRLLKAIDNGKLEQCAVNACKQMEEIEAKWISQKGTQYQYGIKDSAEFRGFLMKEIHGTVDERSVERVYTGNVMNVGLDKHNTLFGFIERVPNNIFFHEFDNPNMDRSYVGKRVSYKIVSNGGQERAVDVRLIEG